jgi:predicted DNA-binding protein YlxM (UPF0122 family)
MEVIDKALALAKAKGRQYQAEALKYADMEAQAQDEADKNEWAVAAFETYEGALKIMKRIEKRTHVFQSVSDLCEEIEKAKKKADAFKGNASLNIDECAEMMKEYKEALRAYSDFHFKFRKINEAIETMKMLEENKVEAEREYRKEMKRHKRCPLCGAENFMKGKSNGQD